MILEQIYEVDFTDDSFGFRPGRSCHNALKALGRKIGTKRVNFISDSDIRSFFDEVDHDKLLELLQVRIGDSDNWRNLMSYRDAVTALVSHWIGRRSQRSMNRTQFYRDYLPRHPLARPRRLTNLFA